MSHFNCGFDSNKLGQYVTLTNNGNTVNSTIDVEITDTGAGAVACVDHGIVVGEKAIFSIVNNQAALYSEIGIVNNSFDPISQYPNNNGIALLNNGNGLVRAYPIGAENAIINTDIGLLYLNDGDIVDVAVDRVNNLIWFRVNDSDWNNDPTQNPITASGGFDISFISGTVYPGVAAYWDSIMSINLATSSLSGFNTIYGISATNSQIYLSDINITSIKLGSDDVSKVFLGEVLVFGGIPATPTITPTITPTATPTPTPSPTPPAFGSSGFQWMTMNSITESTASGIGQNNITIGVTQTGGGMFTLNGMHAGYLFPPEYGVPLTGNQVANTQAGIFTAIFSSPVTDALVAFASVGAGGLPVPVQVLDESGNPKPFTPIWSSNDTVPGTQTTYLNQVSPTQYTQFIGEEGFNIIRIDGTMSSVTFNYGSAEFYCTVCFGFVDQNT